MRTLTICCACLGLALSARAQTKAVFPNQATSAEGESSVENHRGGVPWWEKFSQVPGEQHFRMQVVTDLPAAIQGSITNIAYRRDGSKLPGWDYFQFIVELEATMSTSPTNAANASDFFASNIGNDATQVITRKQIVFGARTFNGSFPEPFSYNLLLDQPFPYNAAQGSLCFDVKHYSNDLQHPLRLTPLTVWVDAMAGGKVGAELRNGGRCTSPNPWVDPIQLNPRLVVDDSSGSPRLRFWAERQYAQHHSRGFLICSLGRSTPGIPVPFGGCGTIEVDLALQFLFSISGSNEHGQVRWPSTPGQYLFDLPYHPSFAGGQWYSQELNFDVHTQDYKASNWVLSQVPTYLGPGGTFPIRVVWAEGPGALAATQGTLGPLGVGPVTEYTYQ